MSCKTPPGMFSGTVASQGDTTAIFNPLSGGYALASFEKYTASWEVTSKSTNVSATLAYRISDDGINWSTPTEVGSAVTALGWAYTGVVTPPTSNTYIQFGVNVKNTTGTNIECCNVRLTVRFQG